MYIYFRDYLYHRVMAFLAALWFGFPSRKLTVVGVTGTKGKSTVVELVAYILEYAGKKTVVSSSVRNMDSGMTMPGRFFLQRLLCQGVCRGCTHAVLEVTSQGVLQSRHRFINWSIAALTNLQPEHIEAHGGFENYRAAKGSFFQYVAQRAHRKAQPSLASYGGQAQSVHHYPVFVINKDDPNAEYFTNLLKSDFNRLRMFEKSDAESNLIGEFNKYNVGCALAITDALGISPDIARQAVAQFPGVLGRMEFIQKEPFAVVVDYAVTPDSLRNVYETLAKRKAQSAKLLCVFGCTGGGRDMWKRGVMGQIAAEYCDEIILTDDDSYDEKPLSIMNEIESGFLQSAHLRSASFGGQANRKSQSVFKIIDRKEAIRKAIELARPGDVVVITGKGGDYWLRKAHGEKIPWSDQQTVRDSIKQIANRK